MRSVAERLPLTMMLTIALGALALLGVFCPSCARREQSASTRWGEIVQHGSAQTPIVIGTFHGDTRIVDTPLQAAVEQALQDVDRTSCGLVKMNIIWDLDVEKDLVRATMRGENIIVSVTEEDTIAAYGQEEGEPMLGYCLYGGTRWVYLVAEKLEDPDTARWVAAHEFSHAIGMDHVDLGLMQKHAPFFPDVPKWERDDLREFCHVWDCNIDMFDDCRSR